MLTKSLILKKLTALFIGLLLFAACATGEEALAKMSPAEKAFVEKIKTIKPEMTEADIERILGPVKRNGGSMRPSWAGPEGSDTSEIAVYFFDGKAQKVRWIKLGSFVWEHEIK